MKPPRSLNITDVEVGTGRKVVPGDVAVCRCRCTRGKGDLLNHLTSMRGPATQAPPVDEFDSKRRSKLTASPA